MHLFNALFQTSSNHYFEFSVGILRNTLNSQLISWPFQKPDFSIIYRHWTEYIRSIFLES